MHNSPVMRTLFLIFFGISISFFARAEKPNPLHRPGQALEGSQILVQFNDLKILKEELVWDVSDKGSLRRCSLKTASYFDEDLVRSTPEAIYTISQGQSQTWLNYSQNQQRDQFNYWLTTDNKDLPLLSFNCELEATPEAKLTHFTLANLMALTRPTLFFIDVVTESSDPAPTSLQLMPQHMEVEVLMDLHFKQTPSGKGYSVDSPRFHNGVLVPEGKGPASCLVGHSFKTHRSEPYELVIKKGEKFSASSFSENPWGYYVLNIESQGDILNLQCFGKPPRKDSAFFFQHLGGPFKFTATNGKK